MHNFILLYLWIVLPNHKTNTVKHGRLGVNSPRDAILLFSLSITGIMFFFNGTRNSFWLAFWLAKRDAV